MAPRLFAAARSRARTTRWGGRYGFLCGGARSPTKAIVGIIDENIQEFGVEPIVRALSGSAARLAATSYCAFENRQLSARGYRDAEHMVVIQGVYAANYSCHGVRTLWKAINL